MTMTDEQLEAIGTEARRAQDAALATRPLPPLVLHRPSSSPPVWLPAVMVGAVSAAVVVVALRSTPAPMTDPTSTSTSTSLSAVSSLSAAPVPVPAWVVPEAGARLAVTDARWVTLTAGNAALAPPPDAAGPAPVLDVGAWQVTPHAGARAVVRWDPAQLALTIQVDDGEVHVRGAGVVGERVLRAGEALTSVPSLSPALSSTTTSTPTSTTTSTTTSRVATKPAPADVQAAADEPVVVEPNDTRTSTSAPTTTWQQLAAAHRYTEALVVARQVGVDAIHTTATAEDLQLLADSARFSLDMDLATSSFAALRRRFAGTLLATRASFYLARIASDVRHDDDEAALLLREYLAGAPDDALSQEAAGRLVEVLQHSDRHLEARDAAAGYLRRWPQGPHARLCRSLTERGAAP